jgi:transcriptional regulator with XRE-family HTH domain
VGIRFYVEKVEHYRGRKGLTQEALAEAIGLERRSLEKALQNGSTSLGTLHKMARVLGVDFEELEIRETSDPSPELPDTSVTASEPFPNQLPFLVTDFQGRDALLVRLGSKLKDRAPITPIVLHGMGGVGKTTLAVALGYHVQSYFSDGVIFFDLEGMAAEPVPVTTVMRHVIESLGITVDPRLSSLEELTPRYRSALSGKRILLIFDNIVGDEHALPLLVGDRVGIVFTSRRALTLASVAIFSIDSFEPHDAHNLLSTIIGDNAGDKEIQQLAKLCGYLPLALRISGDFLRVNPTWSVEEYIRALEDESNRLKMLKVGETEQQNVEIVLKWSAAQLVRTNPPLAMLWYYMARFPGGFTRREAAEVEQLPPDDPSILKKLDDLVSRSMVLYDRNRKRYHYHDLMRLIALGLFGNSQ